MSTTHDSTTHSQLTNAHIVGWGMAVPDQVMTNNDIAAFVDTNDEWIRSRTGIAERRIAEEKDSTATLAYRAARQAMEVADVLPSEIDLIIVATSTPEFVFPSTASQVQDRLGAAKAGAFDLSAACSGFVYALQLAAQMIRSKAIHTALVIGAETMSRILDWQDRSTCILFGDGAGAIVLQGNDAEGGVLSGVLHSDGAGAELLCVPTVNIRELNGHRLQKLSMSGREVFKFATRVMDDIIREAVDKAGITLEELDLIIPHQANQRIIDSAARKLGLSLDRFMSNVERYGNTSAASIPIALCEAIEQGRVHNQDHLAMVGFGGGLTWACAVVQWGVPKPADPNRLNQQRRQLSYISADVRNRLGKFRRTVNEAWRELFR